MFLNVTTEPAGLLDSKPSQQFYVYMFMIITRNGDVTS